MSSCKSENALQAQPLSVKERWRNTLARHCPPFGKQPVKTAAQPPPQESATFRLTPPRALFFSDEESDFDLSLGATELVDGLLSEGDISVIQTAVGLYVAENEQEVRRQAALLPGSEAQEMPDSFRLTTLFQLLTWKGLVARAKQSLDEEEFEQLDFFDSAQVDSVARCLIRALGWFGTAEGEAPEALTMRQLIRKTLILEFESWALPKPGWIAGYEYAKTDNWGRSCQRIRQAVLDHLDFSHRSLEGMPAPGDDPLVRQHRRSRNAAWLALRILAPLAPELAVRRLHKHLRYGSLVWVNFKHGVDLAEALEPGSSQNLGDGQLIALPALKSAEAISDEQTSVLTATRLEATRVWAIINQVLPRLHADERYTPAQIETAVTALDKQMTDAVDASQKLVRPFPLRSDLAVELIKNARITNEITEALADAGEAVSRYESLYPGQGFAHERWGNVRMDTAYGLHYRKPDYTPQFGPRIQYVARTLLDLYMSGERSLDDWRIPGDPFDEDVSRPSLQRRLLYGSLPDLDTGFKAVFDGFVSEQKKAYSTVIVHLLAGLRFKERVAIERGTLTLYSLRQEAGQNLLEEHAYGVQPLRGRRGFIMGVLHAGKTSYYEVFPPLMIIRSRPDITTLEVGGEIRKVERYPDIPYREYQRKAARLPFNWLAYSEGCHPGTGMHSQVIAEPIGNPIVAAAVPGTGPNNLPSPFASTQIAAVADAISSTLFYLDEKTMYETSYEKTAAQEENEQTDPAVWLLKQILPFWQAIEDLSSGSREGVEAGMRGLVVDVLTLGMPFGRFAGGCVRLASHATRISVRAALPGFSSLTKKLLTSTLSLLNPLDSLAAGMRLGRLAGVRLARASIENIRIGIQKFRRASGTRGGRTDSYDLVEGLPQITDVGSWKPLSNLEELASVNGVDKVVVRRTQHAQASRYHLVNPASGKAYGPALERVDPSGNSPMFRVPQRVNGQIGYPLSGRGAGATAPYQFGSGLRITSVKEYDDFLARHDIIQDSQIRIDVRAEVSEGADVRIHVRADGSSTLIMRDSADNLFIDLANNETVSTGSFYDYRQLKSWAVADEAASPDLTRVSIDEITLGRPNIEPERLKRVKDAIENGVNLPPVKVQKTPGGYLVVDGNHRLQAARELNLEKVPVVIVEPAGIASRVTPPLGGSHRVETHLDTPIETILPRRNSV